MKKLHVLPYLWLVLLGLNSAMSGAAEDLDTGFSGLPGSTLEDFFTAAINYSPSLRIAEENLNITGARKRAANGRLLPQVNANASISENRRNQFDLLQEFAGERYSLQLTQALFNWQSFSARKQASLIEDQAEAEYYYELAYLLTDVADKYFNVLQAEDALDSISSELAAVTNQLAQIQSLYDRQLAQITDLYQGQASLAAVQAEQLFLEAELALHEEALRSISGLDVGGLFTLDDLAAIPPLEYNMQFYVEQSRAQNQQIQAREYALRAAQEGIAEKQGAYMPRVTFIAQRQDSDVGFDNLPINRTDNTYIGLDVSIPLYAGGSNRAAVSEARSRSRIAESELRAARLEAGERVRSAYLQAQSSAARTQAARILVESTRLSAEAMQQGFALGTVTTVDVLNALQDQYRAERDLQQTRYEHVKFLLLLKRETGTLEADDMLEVGTWLIPPQA
ncbi:MAG: TolC family protein [Proteobacteria bacterium]|nr:TolC family protein [Pseudomonadota bacterium]